MKKIKFLFVVCLMFMLCPNVSAKEINHFVSKADNDVVIEDEYNSSFAIAGDSLSMDGIVHGISASAGNKITLNGIADYGVIAGNAITINGTINNDLFIAGNLITFGDNANVKRDAIIAARDVELNGTIERNISIYASKVTLKNVEVKGNVKLYAESVVVSNNTKVEGTLFYPEDSSYQASGEASIGATQKTPAIQTEDEENYFATLSAKIWSFLALALVFAAISLFFPNIFNNINEKYEKFEVSEAVEVFTKGLVVFILVPVVAIILCFTMIGIPLGIILLILYGLALYLTTIFTAYLIGYKIWQSVFNKEAHILFFGLIGLVILLILELIPGVRILVTIISVLVGLGLIFDTIKK